METHKETAISIIIPIYNVERYLPMCLESVVLQSFADCEIILVDDGSTDGSREICDKFVTEHKEFRVIYQENQGVSATRNKGVSEAQGEYILFLDADDFLVPQSIGPLLSLAANNNLDILGFGYKTVPEDTKYLFPANSNAQQKIEIISGYNYIARYNYTAQVWWYLVRREHLLESGVSFPVGHVLEEAAFNMKLFLKTKRMAQVPNVAYCYRNRASSIMHVTDHEHVSRMLGSYIYAAASINNVMKEYSEQLQGDCYERCRTRRDSYVLFGAIRAFKIGKVKEYIEEVKENDLYPFKALSEIDYPGAKFKLLHWCVTKPCLWRFLSTIYRIVK